MLIIPELRVLVLTKRHVGSGNEIVLLHVAAAFLSIVPLFQTHVIRLLVEFKSVSMRIPGRTAGRR